MGWMDCESSWSFHPLSCGALQSPYPPLACAVPYLATSASSPSVIDGCALSASMSTASLVEFSLAMPATLSHRPPPPNSPPANQEQTRHFERSVAPPHPTTSPLPPPDALRTQAPPAAAAVKGGGAARPAGRVTSTGWR